MYIIAEIGINHNGSIDLAKKLIDQAHLSGCNAVKFQKRTLDLVYTKEELDKYRESPWGTTNRQQKEGLELSLDQYNHLYDYTVLKNMDFIVSCWDVRSVDDIESVIDVKYHKVASALCTDKEFLQKINETKKPVILSVGMCDDERLNAAVDQIENLEFILACTSTYPTQPKDVNLKNILNLQSKYPKLNIGFSNHYSGLDACAGAVALGAKCIEFHITHDRTAYGSDQAASIENTEGLVSAIRNMEVMLGDGDKKFLPEEVEIAKKLRKVDNILS